MWFCIIPCSGTNSSHPKFYASTFYLRILTVGTSENSWTRMLPEKSTAACDSQTENRNSMLKRGY